MISLNVVVWDESSVIHRCVKSARPYVHEILFMIDRSCRFADQLIPYADNILVGDLEGSIVEHHRNRLIEASKGEWILVLDPDEWIGPRFGPALSELCKTDSDGWYIPRFNIVYNEYHELMVGEDYPDWNLRLFKRHGRYSGVIYEDQLKLSTVSNPLGLSNVGKTEVGEIMHDKTYESREEVKRTLELYGRYEKPN